MKLKCNTEKDKHGRLNYRTAGTSLYHDTTLGIILFFVGVLAGVWPCGTITMLGEIFGAESKAGQVYGHIHSYLFDNDMSTSTIGEII